MGLKAYLPLAFVAFFAATTGADLIARTSIAGQPFGPALHQHLYWAGVQPVGTLFLHAPFVIVALLCAHAEKRARTRSILPIFAVAMVTLLYFYFQGHQAAEHAALKHMWTAASLSVGLLPIFVGAPVVVAVAGAGILAAKMDGRMSA
jgi:hypothetical protein